MSIEVTSKKCRGLVVSMESATSSKINPEFQKLFDATFTGGMVYKTIDELLGDRHDPNDIAEVTEDADVLVVVFPRDATQEDYEHGPLRGLISFMLGRGCYVFYIHENCEPDMERAMYGIPQTLNFMAMCCGKVFLYQKKIEEFLYKEQQECLGLVENGRRYMSTKMLPPRFVK